MFRAFIPVFLDSEDLAGDALYLLGERGAMAGGGESLPVGSVAGCLEGSSAARCMWSLRIPSKP